MANFNDEVEDEFAYRSNVNYPGEWKPIPSQKTGMLLHLRPGTYLFQNTRILQTNIGLTEIMYPELLRHRLHLDYFLASDKPEEENILAEIIDLVGKVNARIDELIGTPNGGNDPGLKELYMALDGVMGGNYDSYIEVPSDTVWENNRECIGIVIGLPEPGLLYKDGTEDAKQFGRKLSISPTLTVQSTAPIEMPECFVKLQRLESFIPKSQMDAYWNRWNSAADKQQGSQDMSMCSVNLQRLETFIPKKQMKAHWKQYWDSVGQQSK